MTAAWGCSTRWDGDFSMSGAYAAAGGRIAGASVRHIDARSSTLQDVEITVACDVANPLFGPHGAAYTFAPQKGANPEEVALLDDGLRNYARVCAAFLGTDFSSVPGAGAAGGLGFALLAFLHASYRSGAEIAITPVRPGNTTARCRSLPHRRRLHRCADGLRQIARRGGRLLPAGRRALRLPLRRAGDRLAGVIRTRIHGTLLPRPAPPIAENRTGRHPRHPRRRRRSRNAIIQQRTEKIGIIIVDNLHNARGAGQVWPAPRALCDKEELACVENTVSRVLAC